MDKNKTGNMKFEFIAELKNGYKKTLATEESTEVRLIIKAKDAVTANRMFRALADLNNIEEYSYVCIDDGEFDEEEDLDGLFEESDFSCCDDPCDYDDFCESDDSCYTPSSTDGDYSPSCPWNAPGMSIRDFI